MDLKAGCEYFKESDVQFLRDVISGEKQIRDDYQELTELIILLGCLPPTVYCSALGPVQHATLCSEDRYVPRPERCMNI